MVSQQYYDFFDEDILAKQLYEYQKRRQIFGDNLYVLYKDVHCNATVSFIWRGVGIAHVSPAASVFMTNSVLLWWALDSVPLPT